LVCSGLKIKLVRVKQAHVLSLIDFNAGNRVSLDAWEIVNASNLNELIGWWIEEVRKVLTDAMSCSSLKFVIKIFPLSNLYMNIFKILRQFAALEHNNQFFGRLLVLGIIDGEFKAIFPLDLLPRAHKVHLHELFLR
jgi:hypothetical protein